jgi:hypothetical protein
MCIESVASTKAKVNVEKAKKTLSRYKVYDLRFRFDEDGRIEAVGRKGSFQGWPGALLVTAIPKREEYDDEEMYFDACYDVLIDEGSDGFTALLGELALCLETPMTILAVSGEEHDMGTSCVWTIEPGSTAVRVLCACDCPGNDRDGADDED